MWLSISSVMSMNMFGIPHSGANVCGYHGSEIANDRLCLNWIQIAAYQPLARFYFDEMSPASQTIPIIDQTMKV